VALSAAVYTYDKDVEMSFKNEKTELAWEKRNCQNYPDAGRYADRCRWAGQGTVEVRGQSQK
jgi:hypothetical protein